METNAFNEIFDSEITEEVSLDEAEEASLDEQRHARRVTILFQTVKLVTDDSEYLCVLRDASETGIKLRHFQPIPDGVGLRLQLANNDSLPIELVWQDDMFAGCRWVLEDDPARIVNAANGGTPHPRLALRSLLHRRLGIRMSTLLRGSLIFDGEEHAIRVSNLSAQGARVECDDEIDLGQEVWLKIHALGECAAVVRWLGDGEYGLVFEEALPFEKLARLTAALIA